jgi:hypothetical protein
MRQKTISDVFDETHSLDHALLKKKGQLVYVCIGSTSRYFCALAKPCHETNDA